MNRGIVIRTVLLSVAVVFAVWQYRQREARAREYALLRQQLESKTHDLATSKTALDDLEQQNRALLERRRTNSTLQSLPRQRAAVTAATSAAHDAEQAEKKRIFRTTLANTLDNPRQKEINRRLLHDELKARIDSAMRKHNFTPEQEEQFLGLLVEYELQKTDRLAALLRDPTRADSALSERDAAWQKMQSDVRSLLGDEGYQLYDQDRQKAATSQADRDIRLINEDLGANALDPRQTVRLRAILAPEISGIVVDDTDTFRSPENWERLYLSHFDHVLQQAAPELTAEQLAALKKLGLSDLAESQQHLTSVRKGFGL